MKRDAFIGKWFDLLDDMGAVKSHHGYEGLSDLIQNITQADLHHMNGKGKALVQQDGAKTLAERLAHYGDF
ncbi:MAG: hypothetical protein GOU98_04585 [Candidatus Altiarchaeota archaeon]|nr:hypothetical protein [Candidatus Altiarchaeota archaeon]